MIFNNFKCNLGQCGANNYTYNTHTYIIKSDVQQKKKKITRSLFYNKIRGSCYD